MSVGARTLLDGSALNIEVLRVLHVVELDIGGCVEPLFVVVDGNKEIYSPG